MSRGSPTLPLPIHAFRVTKTRLESGQSDCRPPTTVHIHTTYIHATNGSLHCTRILLKQLTVHTITQEYFIKRAFPFRFTDCIISGSSSTMPSLGMYSSISRTTL
jgi:hypothetical protein